MKRYFLIETTDSEYRSSYKKICDTLEEAKKEVPNYANWWSPTKGSCSICEVDENFTVYTEYKFENGYPAGVKVWKEG
jgi:hypothetical protein